MKLRLLLPALAVAALATMFSAGEAQAFGHLFGRHHGCCAPEPTCCEPEPTCCAPEPSCCAPEPTCCEPEPSCCEPASCCGHKHCRPFGGFFKRLFAHKHRCCAPACETSCCAPEPSCGCAAEPSCGCN